MERPVFPEHYVWELVELAAVEGGKAYEGHVAYSLEQTPEDYTVYGSKDIIERLLPPKMVEAARAGEWRKDGLWFRYEGLPLHVQRRVEPDPDPIPRPLSLGCGILIGVTRVDHPVMPVWYVNIAKEKPVGWIGTTDWIGEIRLLYDPTRAPGRVMGLAEQILQICPDERLQIGRFELERRLQLVFRSVRMGNPMPYPEIAAEDEEVE